LLVFLAANFEAAGGALFLPLKSAAEHSNKEKEERRVGEKVT